MSYRKATSITETVTLTGLNARGEAYVALVRALRAPEEDSVQAALLGARKQKASSETVDKKTATKVDLELDSPAQIERTLLLGLESWNLDADPDEDKAEDTDPATGLLLINRETLKVLTGGDRNKLFNAINELTSGPDDEEKKD